MMPPRKPLPPITKPHYWKAVKGDQSLYILGTIHIKFDIKEILPIIEKDFKKTDLLFIESPLDIKNRENFLFHYSTYLEREKNRFKDFATKEQFLAYKKIFDKSKFGKKLLEKSISPEESNVFHAVTILQNHMEKRLDDQKALTDYINEKELTKDEEEKFDFIYQTLRDDSVLDKQIHDRALEASKDVLYLDSFEAMLELLKEMNKAAALTLLDASISGKESLEKQFYQKLNAMYWLAKLVNDYRQGKPLLIEDTEKVQKSGLTEKLLKKRNMRWAKVVNSVKPKFKHAFLAVGVAHLYGDDNFLHYLKKSGFKIQKYPF